MLKWLIDIADRLRSDASGQIAPIFAIIALPLLILITLALDSQMVQLEGKKVSGALDSAALAAVIDQSFTEDERESFAKQYFHENVDDHINVKLNVVNSSAERVELIAKAEIPTTLGSIIGMGSVDITERSVSELTKANIICILALAETGRGTFEVRHGAKLNAKSCSVQVNSTDARAAYVDHGGLAVAKSFCSAGAFSTGEYDGKFMPYVNSYCGKVADPYESSKSPLPGKCVDPVTLQETLDSWQAESIGVTLYPGTYCGGLDLYENVVTFAPGEYIMLDGPLSLRMGSRAVARDVTFIMSGKEAVLNLERGSAFEVTATKYGDLAGLAIMQDMRPFKTPGVEFPTGTSTLFSGAHLNITGTVYLPGQKVRIGGGSNMGSRAPATSFIGYHVSIDDGSILNVAVDHVKAGLPPILPRSDDGARLVE